MEIVIRTDQPADETTAVTVQPPAAVAEQAAAVGALNAGAAPSRPDQGGAPPEHIGTELLEPAAEEGQGRSAGPAPAPA